LFAKNTGKQYDMYNNLTNYYYNVADLSCHVFEIISKLDMGQIYICTMGF